MRGKTLTGAVAVATMLGLTACGSDSSAGETQSGSTELEVAELTVGALPITDYGALYWAQDKGFFEDAGLSVTLEPVQGGPIGAQNVATGQLDFSISNVLSTSVATQSGLPIQTVVHLNGLGSGGLSVYVAPDSPIRTLADLDGATIGINATRNIGDVTLRNVLDEEGLADVSPRFVEVPFPEMLAGVQSGALDVGYSPEPFSSAALEAGMREIVDLADPDGPNAGLGVGNLVSSDQFIADNPNTVRAFVQAVYAASADILDNEAEFRAWLPGITRVPASVAENMELPDFYTEVHLDEMGRIVDMLTRQGVLQDGYKAADHTYVLPD